ncbi:MAG TPA: amino acid adenylation domain-containing protein, partial [Jatrophihabitans sp.]|nr:amino acid adenylation domain-containing protein [Jatrophihabitans sp.]
MNGYRLSPGQRLAWEGGFPLLTARVELAEPPEPARLQAAWAAVVGQHEALRLTLIRHSGLRVPLQDVDDRREPFVGGQGEVSLTVAGATLTLAVTPLFGDPASLRLVLADLAAAYAGRPPAEDPDRLQYLDVCEWQREAREAAGSREPAALADASPADASLAAVAHPPAPTTEHLLPAAELRARAAELDVPVGSLLLAAWTMALARFAEVAPGTTDAGLALAAWTDGRYVPGTETVVGPLGGFARARVELPLPVDPAAAVRLVHTAQQAAEQDHHLTEPAGPVAGSFGCWPAADPTALAGLAATGVRIGEPTPPGGPCLFAEVGAEAVRLVLTAAEPLRESLLAILAGLPAALADGVPLAARGPREEAWLIGASGAGQAAEHRPTTLTALLDAGIAAAPADAPAVIAADGRLSFAELSRAGDAVAAGLARAGVRRGDRVAVLAGRTTGTVAAMLGILRAGAVYLPLDPASPQPRSAALVEAAGARFVIGDQIVEGVASATVAELTAGSAWTGERGESSPLDPAYLIFTSGSTGEPRGVLVSQASAAHLVAALEAGVYRDGPDAGRVAVNAPLTFDASIKQLVQLANGRTLCLIPEEVRLDGQDLAATLAEYEVGTLDITPSHLQLLLAAPQPYLPRQLLIGGEPIPAELWQRLAELPSVRAVNVYGPTECTVDSTAAEVLPGTEPNIGRPLPGTEVWVLDEHLRPVPPQVSGELCVAGPQVALGYLGDDAATERRFVEVSLPGGGRRRVYRTGDLVRFDAEARLHFLGRIDNQVKIRGHRIEPAEIEAVLAGHPAVGEAVVVARDDDGQGKRLVGYLRPAGTAVSVDLAELQGVNPHETRYLYDEIFQQQVYLQHGITLREGAVVFDVGANIGMFSLFVHAACPGATIHAFEPIPQVHSALRANVDRYAVPAVLHDFGLSATAGEVEFTYYPGYSVMSGQADYADPAAEVAVIKRYLSNEVAQGDSDGATLLARADELLADRFTASTVRVTLQPLSAVIDAAAPPRIDLLKIDVQRAEADVLAGIAERHWALIDQIAMEVHDAIGTETEGRV